MGVAHLLHIRSSSLKEGEFIQKLPVNLNVNLRHRYMSLLLFCALLHDVNNQEKNYFCFER